MPSRTYTTKFVFDSAAANSAIGQVTTKLKALDDLIGKVDAKGKTLFAVHPGLASFEAALKKVDVELKSKIPDARAAASALDKVRGNSRALSAMTKQLASLKAELDAVKNAAQGAGNATASVVGGGLGAGVPGGGKGAAKGSGIIGKMVRTAMGLGAIRSAVTGIGDASKEQSEFLSGAAGRTAEVRESLKEYAGLRGQDAGPTNAIVREVTDFAMSTGASVDEAAEFLTSYEGSAPTGRDKGNVGGKRDIDPKTGKEIRTLQQEALEIGITRVGGQFATAVGLDPATAGDLTGVVGQYKKINGLDDFTKELAGLHYGLDKGRGRISSLARSELGAAGQSITSGQTSDLSELGAWIGVTSSISKTAAGAGTSYKQTSRLLNELPGNKEGDWLKSIGVTGAKGDTAKLNVLADFMRDNKISDPATFLHEKGFGNDTEIAGTVGMLANRDVLNRRIAEARNIKASSVYERIDKDQGEQMVQTRKGQIAEDVAIINKGQGQETLEAARAQARATMIKEDRLKATGFFGPAYESMVVRPMSIFSTTGEEQRVDEEVRNQLMERGKKVGVNDIYSKFEGQMGTGVGVRDDSQFAKTVATQTARVQAAEEAGAKIVQGAQLILQGGQQIQRQGNGGPGGNAGGAVVPDRR